MPPALGTIRFGAGRLLCVLIWLPVPLQAAVGTSPGPASETLSTEYEGTADGKKVDVYTARVLDPPFAGKQWDYGGPYAFANFDMSGRITVAIKPKRSLRDTVLRPAYPDVQFKVPDEQTPAL